MKRSQKRTIPTLLAATVVLAVSAGGVAVAGAAEAPADQILVAGPVATQTLAANAADHDDPADYQFDTADVVPITLTGSTASTTGTGVTINAGQITITAPGTYQLTGTLTNGQVAVNTTTPGTVQLILNGTTITSNTSAALNVTAATKAVIILAAGTTNRLTDATQYVYPAGVDEPNAALFSDTDLTITGTGTLDVQGNAFDGIASKDGLIIDSGTITVDAVDDGIRGKSYLVINGANTTVTAGGDGLKSDEDADATMGYVSITAGTANVTAAGDGVDALTDAVISGGELTARTGGGSTATVGDASAKGMKAGVVLVLSDGRTSVDSADDGVHSDAAVTIEGGTHTVATADDGVHAETTLDVVAGSVTVTRSFEGLEALKLTISGGTVNSTSSDDSLNASEEGLDEFAVAPNAFIRITGGTVVADGGTDGIDSNGTLAISGGTTVVAGSATRGGGEGGMDSNGALTITGGTLLASGISASTSTLPSSGQGWVRTTLSANQPAGTIVHLATTTGTQIAAFQATKAFRQVVFSSNQITRGQSYDIYTGGSVSGTAVGGGMYAGGTLSGTRVATVAAGQ